MIDVSIITIVNKLDIYKNFLDNLNKQEGVNYELIEINNCNNQYSSAREALNIASENAKGKYIMYIHPDVYFNSKQTLFDILSSLNRIDCFGVVGVAGCPEKLENGKRILLSNIVHGPNKKRAGRYIEREVPVQTVDECLFIIKNVNTAVFSNKEGWHLYAVELCLDKIIEGNVNYVIPADVWHMSDGKSLDYKYVIQLKKLIREYKIYFDTINTTVKKWKTHGLRSIIFINYYMIKQYLKGKIKDR